MSDAPERQADALLRAMIASSAYRDYLLPIEDEVVRVAFLNRQVREALLALSAAGGRTSRFSFGKRGPDEALLLSFLEYVAFASPGFLASVGEWPLGRAHG
ncbi:hypothetical protein [Ancylobacter sp.]|uniref:hypothetical protein n=1 Tax=Ancylobacter sp. TaxID=1872567 RepID=UPI003D0CA3E3